MLSADLIQVCKIHLPGRAVGKRRCFRTCNRERLQVNWRRCHPLLLYASNTSQHQVVMHRADRDLCKGDQGLLWRMLQSAGPALYRAARGCFSELASDHPAPDRVLEGGGKVPQGTPSPPV